MCDYDRYLYKHKILGDLKKTLRFLDTRFRRTAERDSDEDNTLVDCSVSNDKTRERLSRCGQGDMLTSPFVPCSP